MTKTVRIVRLVPVIVIVRLELLHAGHNIELERRIFGYMSNIF